MKYKWFILEIRNFNFKIKDVTCLLTLIVGALSLLEIIHKKEISKEEKEEICKRFIKFSKKLRWSGNVNTLLAGFIYLELMVHSIQITQREIADVCGTNEYSVRISYKKIIELPEYNKLLNGPIRLPKDLNM